MANELDNNTSSVSVSSDSESAPKSTAGYEIISWLNRSIKKYKNNPPKELIDAYMQSHPELTQDEVMERLDFNDLIEFLLKKLDSGYNEYMDHPDMPSAKLMKDILDSKFS